MIERDQGSGIGPLAPVGAAAERIGGEAERVVGALARAALGGAGVPLAALAADGAARLSQAAGAEPVAAAQLERTTLAFAREVKALAIAHPARSADTLAARVEDAIAAGRAAADALPDGINDAVTRQETILRTAADHLATGF